jgi:superfamily II DNA or RNA helicase
VKFQPREYQKRIIDAQDRFIGNKNVSRGTILAATGAGKTECFNDLIRKVFLIGDIIKRKQRILICHPRIALSQNQQKRMVKRLADMHVEFTSFHSGNQKYHTLPDRKNVSTTNRDELVRILAESAGHHITFSSYKSLNKIADLSFDLIICDEAHNLVQSDLRDSLSLFTSKTLFYTGTPVKVAAQEESMDNVDLFGEILAEVPPSELIPFGYVVPPRLRTVDVKNKTVGNTPDYATCIAETFKDQQSFAHKKFVHKMLVAMPSTLSFNDIMDELPAIRTIIGNQKVDVYYITSDTQVKNGRVLDDREAALDDFDSNPNPSIIIHCDTLAEGIDVDGIGGVLIMRGLGMTKAIQTIGRAARPSILDIKKNGEIKNENSRVKKECIVTLARIDGDWCGDTTIADWANLFRVAGYGDIWDFCDPRVSKRGGGGELQEADDALYDEIKEIKFLDGVDRLWDDLREAAKNA